MNSDAIEIRCTQREVRGEHFRIQVLTDRLIRLEYSPEDCFTDERTQMVDSRDFSAVPFTCETGAFSLTLTTEALRLTYDGKPFSGIGLCAELFSTGFTWHYGQLYGGDGNLGGTARTLDMTDGFIMLENGIFSRTGCVAIDDSASALITEEGICQRNGKETDLYFFGYGRDYLGGLKAFYQLCGHTPLLPRYALGNWWSRFYPYTESSYLEMLDNFEKEKIPLSVGVIDMDWHVTEVDPKYGNGWTGFSWNREYFPEPSRFLRTVHEKGLAVTLNLHPADGIRAFEDMYPQVAEKMGIDPASELPVVFDLSDEDFRRTYFEDIIHPLEKEGVDFWWIDWQQGTKAGASDLDPLWLLNYYHFRDKEKDGHRPMIFSRYAGVGSHRYPVGFSGDTFCTWASLKLQPWFTSTASNIGYGWWSHDIGGHMQGDKDTERLVRWVQFGVFSPIMRLHSSSNPFFIKEPWKLEQPYRQVMKDYMRLRARLLPYLYTMNARASREGIPLVCPLYYLWGEDEAAYDVPSEYLFGSELLAAPITEKTDEELRLARVSVLIPEGRYYDMFTGRIYTGRSRRNLYRPLEQIPVLLKEGGILPLTGEDEVMEDCGSLPAALDVYVGFGADGSFILYEDDGITQHYKDGHYAETRIETIYEEELHRTMVRILPAAGDLTLLPGQRRYRVILCGAAGDERNRLIREQEVNTQEGADFLFEETIPAQTRKDTELFTLLERAWISMNLKEKIYDCFRSLDEDMFITRLKEMEMPEKLRDAVAEIFA